MEVFYIRIQVKKIFVNLHVIELTECQGKKIQNWIQTPQSLSRFKTEQNTPPFNKLLLTHTYLGNQINKGKPRRCVCVCVFIHSKSSNYPENPLAVGVPILYMRKQVQRLDSASSHMAQELGAEGATHPSWLCVFRMNSMVFYN